MLPCVQLLAKAIIISYHIVLPLSKVVFFQICHCLSRTQAYLGSTTNVTIWSKRKCRDDLDITHQSPACIVDHPDVKPVLHEALREAVKQCAAAFKEHR